MRAARCASDTVFTALADRVCGRCEHKAPRNMRFATQRAMPRLISRISVDDMGVANIAVMGATQSLFARRAPGLRAIGVARLAASGLRSACSSLNLDACLRSSPPAHEQDGRMTGKPRRGANVIHCDILAPKRPCPTCLPHQNTATPGSRRQPC